MSRELKVIIKPDGTVVMDAVGFKGIGCDKATQALTELATSKGLGLTVTEDKKKREWGEEEASGLGRG